MQESGKYAENQRGRSEMSMLDEVAAEAAALAEMQTQVGDLPTTVDSMEAETAKMAGHIVKRLAVATGEDGGPAGCPQLVDDCENAVLKVRLQAVRRTSLWGKRIGNS